MIINYSFRPRQRRRIMNYRPLQFRFPLLLLLTVNERGGGGRAVNRLVTKPQTAQ
jgi:hypothetical protein